MAHLEEYLVNENNGNGRNRWVDFGVFQKPHCAVPAWALAWVLLASVLVGWAVDTQGEEACASGLSDSSLESWSGFADTGEEPCWLLEIDAAAVLSLTVRVPLTALAEPTLYLGGGEAVPLRLSPNTQVYWIPTAATLSLTLKSQHPTLPLGEYRVDLELAGTQEQEIEPDLTTDVCFGSEDDHGDHLECSTHLETESEVGGVVGNPQGDDVDVFDFYLSEPRTVMIETTGTTDLVGALEDDRGYRLAVDGDGGEGENFRLRKALVPGRYFVRVAGQFSAEGSYRIRLTTESW